MVVKLHHVEFLCNNLRLDNWLVQFCQQFGLRPFAEAVHPRRVAIRRNSIIFVLTEDTTTTDTAFNVTLEVKDVDESTRRVDSNGGHVLAAPTTSKDSYGHTLSSVIQTPCGNVVHTLIDKSNYNGPFLPGFNDLTTQTLDIVQRNCLGPAEDEHLLTHLDHIAFACHQDTSLQVIDWYRKCLGFTRFELNDDEKEDGFKIESTVNGKTVGLKLSAMEYWKCSEFGIEVKSNDPRGRVKFVLAEPLPGQGPNQIQTFLEEHGGPGIQHIALHSTDMVHAVDKMKKDGAQFITQPDAYYTQPDKVQEILSSGQSVEDLKTQSILLDAESFTNEHDNNTKYLMQVFTKPLFDKNTFFLEIIQRFGATGFGSGNIKALWRALDEHLSKEKKLLIDI